MIEHARWVSDITFEGAATIDQRYIVAGALSWRQLPLSLMAMHVNSGDGHVGSYVAGRIDRVDKDSVFDMNGQPLPIGSTALRGSGVFDLAGVDGANIARLVNDEMLRGISVDLAIEEIGLRNPENGEVKTLEEIDYEDVEAYFMGKRQLAIIKGTMVAATVVPTPAFDDARISLTASAAENKQATIVSRFKLLPQPQELVAAPLWVPGATTSWSDNVTVTNWPEYRIETAPNLTAAAVQTRPPREWFETQELPGPTPLTILDDGRVFGHVALWESCHVGFGEMCVKPPRSASHYAYFHVGELTCDDGNGIAVGKLMYAGPHAGQALTRAQAARHYDSQTHVAAYLRAQDGQYGIWVSGVLRSGLTDDDIEQIKSNPPSGDWRGVNGQLEMIAALAVPVPGFPVPRAEMAVVSSGDEVEVQSLILSSGEYELQPLVRSALIACGALEDTQSQIELLAAEAEEDPVQALVTLAEEP